MDPKSMGEPGKKADRPARELVEMRRNMPMRPVLSIPTLARMGG